MEDSDRTPRRFYKSEDRIFFGVCGGLAEYFNWPPWAVRILFIILQFTVAWFMFIVYIALAIFVPRRPVSGTVPGAAGAPRYESGRSRAEALRRLTERFEVLDKRLQKMESIVTRPGWDIEDEFKKL